LAEGAKQLANDVKERRLSAALFRRRDLKPWRARESIEAMCVQHPERTESRVLGQDNVAIDRRFAR
jgi:hypothetical protein